MFPWFCVFLLLLDGTVGKPSVRLIAPGKQSISFEEFISGAFYARDWNGNWLKNNTLYYRSHITGDVVKFDVKTREATRILGVEQLKPYKEPTVKISGDEQYVLISYNVSSVFRHSTTAQFAIYSLENGEIFDINDRKPVQIATFAPEGNGLAYVFENNIYYIPKPEDASKPIQLTTEGIKGIVYCGVPDWVYEEEVLGDGSAMWFSPDGKHLAYAVFDDTNVRNYTYIIYGEPGSLEYQYPTQATIKYPKVGEKNPVVKLNIQDLTTLTSKKVELPPEAAENVNDFILYGITWIQSKQIVAVTTNRVQNQMKFLRCTLEGACEVEQSYQETKGWIEAVVPHYSEDGKQRLEILVQPEGDDSYDHLVLTDIKSQTQKRLTNGPRTVTKIVAWDEAAGLIYYEGTVNNGPSQTQVYTVSTKTGTDTCLTCNFVIFSDGPCKSASAVLSKDNSYLVKICSGPGPTFIQIENTSDPSDTIIWEDNLELRHKLAIKALPKIQDVKITLASGYIARVRLLLPPDLDVNSPRKYPAIVRVYAGPNSNMIDDAYSVDFEHYLVTSREYIYVFIDGRGSGKDGKNKIFELYHKFGTIEIEDQLAAIRCLHENIPYIDAANTGIWGWSYGGFSAVWALVKDNQNILKFGLSVAPVTSFIYYDTIYTERYMGLPTETDNLLGYNNTDVTRHVEGLRGKSYMLIHGNADDNVHYQQSMLLAKALERADLPFRQQSYPDENHSIQHFRKHLYHTIDQFFAQNLPEYNDNCLHGRCTFKK